MTKVCKQAFRQTYLATGSVKQTAEALGITEPHAYRLRQSLSLPKFPPESRSARPPSENDLRLAEAIARDMTCGQAAELLGRSPDRLRKRRRMLGLPPFKQPPRPKGESKAPLDRIVALRRAGLSYRQMAIQLGTTRSAIAGTIHHHLRGLA